MGFFSSIGDFFSDAVDVITNPKTIGAGLGSFFGPIGTAVGGFVGDQFNKDKRNPLVNFGLGLGGDLASAYLQNELITSPNAREAYAFSKEGATTAFERSQLEGHQQWLRNKKAAEVAFDRSQLEGHQQWLRNRKGAETAWEREKEGAELAFERSMSSSAHAFNRSLEAYKNRYANTMLDMKRAGLNPILAAGSGGFNVGNSPQMSALPAFKPGGAQASAQRVVAPMESVSRGPGYGPSGFQAHNPALKTASEAMKNMAQIFKIRKEKDLVSAQEKETYENVQLLIAKTVKTFKEAYLAVYKSELTEAQKDNIIKLTKALEVKLKKLKYFGDVYDTPTGQGLAWIEMFLKAIGIHFSGSMSIK
jgi:hypothetical protein